MTNDNNTITPPPSSLQPPLHPSRASMPMLYYGLIVVGTAAIMLAVYNLVIIRWCSNRYRRESLAPTSNNRLVEISTAATSSSRSFDNPRGYLLTSYKYKKEENRKTDQDGYECAVCLSVFEEGEEVRQLPRCKHSFHGDCIDMWLYSHHDCPLCRAIVDSTSRSDRCRVSTSDNSREGLLGLGLSSV
ncbi:hypothetical protein ACFE04_019084 [Oxalis oulophora]